MASALNLLDVEAVVIGGGLGLRLGEPYVERIREAMLPHLFADHQPPEVLLASLGDLGGAIGATLLAAGEGARAAGLSATRRRRDPATGAGASPRAAHQPGVLLVEELEALVEVFAARVNALYFGTLTARLPKPSALSTIASSSRRLSRVSSTMSSVNWCTTNSFCGRS